MTEPQRIADELSSDARSLLLVLAAEDMDPPEHLVRAYEELEAAGCVAKAKPTRLGLLVVKSLIAKRH